MLANQRYEKLVAVFKVIEYRDGCIYRTAFIEERWIDMDTPYYSINENDEQIVSLSSKRQAELGFKGTIRKVVESKDN